MGRASAYGSSHTLHNQETTTHENTTGRIQFLIKLYGFNFSFPYLPFPLCKYSSILACRPEYALGCNTFFLPNKSFW